MKLERKCAECGKTFPVVVSSNGTYVGGGYYGCVMEGIGDWPAATVSDEGKLIRAIPRYKELWFRLRDFKRLLLNQYTRTELWFCEECEHNHERI